MRTRQKRRIKVLMLSSSYPRGVDDTASVFLRNLAQHLLSLDIAVHVLTPADYHSGVSNEKGVIVHRFAYFPRRWAGLAYGSGILPNLRKNPMLWAQVPFFVAALLVSSLRVIIKHRPDVIHAHWIIPQGAIALICKHLLRIPIVTTAHGGDAFAMKRGMLAGIKQAILRGSNACTANTNATSTAAAGSSSASLLAKTQIIPMGVDIDRFHVGRKSTHAIRGETDHVILFVGRLVEKKGVAYLIEAFSLLPSGLRTNAELWIVGDGDKRSELEALARRLEIHQCTRFFGRVPNDDLPNYYAAADLFVGPSIIDSEGDTEGQGVVFLEALASGVPVVATQVGGIEEVVEHDKTGVLVTPRDSAALAAAIADLLSDPLLRSRLATAGREAARTKYAWDGIAARFASLYRAILAEESVA